MMIINIDIIKSNCSQGSRALAKFFILNELFIIIIIVRMIDSVAIVIF